MRVLQHILPGTRILLEDSSVLNPLGQLGNPLGSLVNSKVSSHTL